MDWHCPSENKQNVLKTMFNVCKNFVHLFMIVRKYVNINAVGKNQGKEESKMILYRPNVFFNFFRGLT